MVPLPLDPPVSVSAGTKYSIVLLAVGLPCFDGYGWQQADGSTYPAGEAFSWLGFSGWGRVPSDYMFNTYVDTALPGAYAFEGFFDPVMNPPALNRWPATKPLPIRFSLGGDQGLDVFDGRPQVTPISCLTLQPISGSWNALMSPLVLGQDGVYQFLWNTVRRAAGRCRQLTVNLADGTSHSVFVRFGATAVVVVRADRIERGKAVQATVSVTCDPIPADSYAALTLTIFQGRANSPYYREGQGGVGLEGINGLICDGARHTYSFTVRLTSFFVDKRSIPGEAGFEWVVQVCSPTVCSLAGGPTQGRVKIQP